jgi:hypothetical protein
MENELEEYSYLWRDSDGSWALFYINHENPSASPEYLIVNTKEKSALLIEDDDLADEIQTKMMAVGVPIVWPGNGF